MTQSIEMLHTATLAFGVFAATGTGWLAVVEFKKARNRRDWAVAWTAAAMCLAEVCILSLSYNSTNIQMADHSTLHAAGFYTATVLRWLTFGGLSAAASYSLKVNRDTTKEQSLIVDDIKTYFQEQPCSRTTGTSTTDSAASGL